MKLKVAVLQMRSLNRQCRQNTDTVIDRMRRAAARGLSDRLRIAHDKRRGAAGGQSFFCGRYALRPKRFAWV